MFDLNGEDFQEKEVKGIFNGGEAGKVTNVKINDVEKKSIDGAPGAPDYKVYFEDENGQLINVGFWKSPKNEKIEVQRALHIARAVLGKDYKFPTVNSCEEAIDSLMKLIKQNFKDKSFNVFVCYGNVDYPSKYLGLRYFDFVETSDTPDSMSKLFTRKNDQMTRIEEDEVLTDAQPQSELDSSAGESDDDWV